MIYAPAQETDLAVSGKSGEVGEKGSPGGKRTVHPSKDRSERDITDKSKEIEEIRNGQEEK